MSATEEARDNRGRWTVGGAVAKAVAGALRGAADWIDSGVAQRAIDKVVTTDNAKAGISALIKSGLYHLGQVDDPGMAVMEPYIDHHVHNISDTLNVSAARVRAMRDATMSRLISARRGTQ